MMAVDVGGTFTDVVAVRDGKILTAKVPTDPGQVHESVIAGGAELGLKGSAVFNHASTHGLNAVITRSLPKVGFLTTEGHRDILDQGRTWRPPSALTNPHWRRSFGDAARPLVDRYLRRGVPERMKSDGQVFIELDEAAAREELRLLKRCNVEGVAICLLNAYVNPAHERRLRELVTEELGAAIPCSISSEVSPLAKEYARASTTLVDVFMKIIYGDYTKRLDAGLRKHGFEGELNFADCAATLVPADVAMESPFRIVFAGPAGGTVGSAHFGSLTDEQNLICADVGGTSCDISLVTNGKPFVNTLFELEHDLVVNALSNDISSIGAGGGSLVAVSPAGDITVGPGSAGANPGPACYGKGGTRPTTSDICLLIGLLDPDGFAGGKMKLNVELAKKAVEGLDCRLNFEQRVRYAYEIAVNNIAEGVFNVAIKNGIDPRDYSLMAYGAAGPLLLPAIAPLIHVRKVIVPPHPGLFSALGLLSAEQAYSSSRTAYTILTPEVAPQIDKVFREMEAGLKKRLALPEGTEFSRTFDGQLVGQTWETPFVEVPAGPITADTVKAMIDNFHVAYEARNGDKFTSIPVQGVTYRVRAIVPTSKIRFPELDARKGGKLKPVGSTTLHFLEGGDQAAHIYSRNDLCAGDEVMGPAIIREALSTTHVGKDQVGRVGTLGEIVIEQV